MLSQVVASVPNVSKLRLVNGAARGADAAAMAAAILQWGSLRTLQLHQVRVVVVFRSMLASSSSQTARGRLHGVHVSARSFVYVDGSVGHVCICCC